MEYKGVEYKDMGNGKWQMIWPSGIKTIANAPGEAEIKARIDQLKRAIEEANQPSG